MLTAMTRAVSSSLGRCELTHLPRTPIDPNVAEIQHRRYEAVLEELGCTVLSLPPLEGFPDAVFVEDVAVVLDELAVLTRPGAEPRRGEVASVAERLAGFRPVSFMEEPGTLDGGDVLRLGRRLYVGQSSRSNEAGIRQLAALVEPHGYTVTPVTVSGCLHLKSAVTQVSGRAVLVNPDWVEPGTFAGFDAVPVDPAEPLAANGLLVGGALVYPSSFPRTLARLVQHGIRVAEVDVSELQKAEGAVTCCSLIFETSGA